VFAGFQPVLTDETRTSPFVFLANIDPALQTEVLEQFDDPRVVACDTMNHWIETAREPLIELLPRVDLLILNDEEARMMADERNIPRAARRILDLGPRSVLVKRGEYGAILFSAESVFAVPAYPLEEVFDPTGAGDTFAGGFMGYIAAHIDDDLTDEVLRRAMAYGTALASFNVEGFGTERMQTLTADEISSRVSELQRVNVFDATPVQLRA